MSPVARRHLDLVPDPAMPATAATRLAAPAPVERPAVLRLCAGEALLLHEDEIDFVELVNSAGDFEGLILDAEADPDQYRLAEVAVEYYCDRYGLKRQANGDRLVSVISTYRRYLVPFLVELDATRPEGRRGVADLSITHLDALPRVLAGDRPLPAATVAGDRLGRRGISCVYLGLTDAAAVTVGGRAALDVALASGAVLTHPDARTGEDLIRTADLRAAGILVESATPHGLAKSTAGNVLRDLRLALERARDHGAAVRGRFRLEAIEPLTPHRLREQKPDAQYVSLDAIAATTAYLPVIGQVVLWISRLVGERISEVYGLYLTDYVRDDQGRPWLVIDSQGGRSTLGRDPLTGMFRQQDHKNRTKTPAGTRTVPIPRQLAQLLDILVAVFHTDADTGAVDWAARLIPGLQSENISGQSSFRGWLKVAQAAVGVVFDPHDTRAALITDLKNGGIDDRVAHHYAGHEHPEATIQDKHYDLGPYSELLIPVVDLLETLITDQVGSDDLLVPTTLTESWGRGTRRHRQAAWIEDQLRNRGWRSGTVEPHLGRQLDAAEVADRIGRSPSYTRKLMREGTIAAHTVRWGSREVWVAWENDVQQYLDACAGVTIGDLGAELGWSYHQTWHVLRELELMDLQHDRGAPIRLTAETADRVRAEATRRQKVCAAAVTLAEAARVLNMEVGVVQTLVRRGQLEVTQGPDQTQHRYVTRDSVDAYLIAHPASSSEAATATDQVLLTFTDARRLLQVTRPELSMMTRTRQVQTANKTGSRHTYITADSAIASAEKMGRPTALEAVRAHVENVGS